MARMHSRDKGKSGSTKPQVKVAPKWVGYSTKEIELLIVKYAKEGNTASKIGLILRDKYGIPDVKLVTSKTITAILKEKGQGKELPEDLLNLMQKVVDIKEHLIGNHKDEPAKRGLTLTESKILRLIKYYKRSGRIPTEWKYDPKQIKMYLG